MVIKKVYMLSLITITLLIIVNINLFSQRVDVTSGLNRRQKIVSFIPPLKEGLLYGGKFVSVFYDEPETSGVADLRFYPYIYYGYRSLGVYVRLYSRYVKNSFRNIRGYDLDIDNEEEHFGYDNTLISDIQRNGKVYLLDYYIIIRNLRYFFGRYLKELKIGKLWINFSPYTIQRTFGPEGIYAKGEIPLFNYDIFYSYNRTSNTNYTTSTMETNSRHMIGVKFRLIDEDIISLDLVGVYYYANPFRNEKIDSIKLYKKGILDIFTLKWEFAERYHLEGESGYNFINTLLHRYASASMTNNTYYYGNYNEYVLGVNLRKIVTKISFIKVRGDFLPEKKEDKRFDPLRSSLTKYNKIEGRDIERKQNLWIINVKYLLGGVVLTTYFEINKYKDYAGQLYKYYYSQLEVSYQFRDWTKINNGFVSYSRETEKMNDIYVSMWVPLYKNGNSKISFSYNLDYYIKYSNKNTLLEKPVHLFEITYGMGSLKVKLQVKKSPLNSPEPDWLKEYPYYVDQEWGIDNFVSLNVEYDF